MGPWLGALTGFACIPVQLTRSIAEDKGSMSTMFVDIITDQRMQLRRDKRYAQHGTRESITQASRRSCCLMPRRRDAARKSIFFFKGALRPYHTGRTSLGLAADISRGGMKRIGPITYAHRMT